MYSLYLFGRSYVDNISRFKMKLYIFLLLAAACAADDEQGNLSKIFCDEISTFAMIWHKLRILLCANESTSSVIVQWNKSLNVIYGKARKNMKHSEKSLIFNQYNIRDEMNLLNPADYPISGEVVITELEIETFEFIWPNSAFEK